ncbi:MAG: hypothetical protein M5U19_22545 [Microthrixaceae bacterium]|nr:hypothetical protein [Microthrixaceae bacterium]
MYDWPLITKRQLATYSRDAKPSAATRWVRSSGPMTQVTTRTAETTASSAGEQPAGPAKPEVPQGDAVGRLAFAHQQAGDQEPAEHEEEVDTEESPRGCLGQEVRKDHQYHGETAKAVECLDVLEPRGLRPVAKWGSVRLVWLLAEGGAGPSCTEVVIAGA